MSNQQYIFGANVTAFKKTMLIKIIILIQAFHKDLQLFLLFLISFDGVSIYDNRPLDQRLYLDVEKFGGC